MNNKDNLDKKWNVWALSKYENDENIEELLQTSKS